MSLYNIYEGWKNHLLPSDRIKELIINVSEERLKICRECEHHSKFHSSIRPDEHCTYCGCSLLPKTKCLSCKCPVDKWSIILTEEQEKEINIEENE